MVVVCRDFLGVYNLQPDPWRFQPRLVIFALRYVSDLGSIHIYVFFGLKDVASEVEFLFHGFMAQSYDLVYKFHDFRVVFWWL